MAHEHTQRIDLEGSVARALFLGSILEENLYPPVKRGVQLEELLSGLREFLQSKKEDFRYFDKVAELSSTYLKGLRERRLFGVAIPREYGGLGLSALDAHRVYAELNTFDGATAHLVAAHNSIGVAGLLLYGNEEQKRKFLPPLATGEQIGAFCLTERGAGSDAGAIRATAVRSADGSWILNGEKTWVSNGVQAGLFTVFARTESPQGKITAFLVDRATAGVQVGPKIEKLGLTAASTPMLVLKDVRVEPTNVLGIEGNGFKVAMSILNFGRLALAATCVGAMKECLSLASKHVSERRQFGHTLAEFDLIQEKIAALATACYASESAVRLIAALVDAGVHDFSVEATMVKVFATDSLWQVANEVLQIAGADGCCRDQPYERILRNARLNLFFHGTNEVLRLYIGLSGMKGTGEHQATYGASVARIFNEPIKSLGLLSALVSHTVSDLTALGRDRFTTLHPDLREHAAVLEQYASRLHRATEAVLAKFGKDVVDEQFSVRRIADVATDLFIGTALLARITESIQRSSLDACRDELSMAQIYTRLVKRRMNYNLRRLITNEDEAASSVAASVISHRGYPWEWS